MTAGSSVHEFAFLKRFVARPWKVASPIPSGRKLATRVAAQVEPQPGHPVLELGPGTGAVTHALRAGGVAEEDLVLIESDPGFVRLLRAEFPRANVVEGDAFAFAERVAGEGDGFAGIVSGLPVMGEPAARKRRFVKSAIDALAPGCPFVQFTYSRRAPLPQIDGVEISRAATVWENVWPMHIWVYRRSGTKLRNVVE